MHCPVCVSQYTHTPDSACLVSSSLTSYCSSISRGPGITSKSCLAKLTLGLPLQRDVIYEMDCFEKTSRDAWHIYSHVAWVQKYVPLIIDKILLSTYSSMKTQLSCILMRCVRVMVCSEQMHPEPV